MPAPPLIELRSLPAAPIFTVDGVEHRAADVLVAADVRGDLAAPLEALAQELAAERALRAAGREIDRREVKAEVNAWRTERDLVAADDAEAWLSARGLKVRDLSQFAARRVARRRVLSSAAPVAPPPRAGAGAEAEPPKDDLGALLYPALALSGALDRLANDLAWRATVHAAWKAGPRTDPTEPELRRRIDEASARRPPPAVEAAGVDRARLLEVEALFECAGATVLHPERVARALDRARLDLVRLDLVDVALATEDAAEEAALCVSMDGEPLEAVAARAGAAPLQLGMFAEELPAAVRALLLSRRAGDIAGPVALDGAFHLFELREKAEPRLDDPRVEARLVARLLRREYQGELEARVRWGPWRPASP